MPERGLSLGYTRGYGRLSPFLTFLGFMTKKWRKDTFPTSRRTVIFPVTGPPNVDKSVRNTPFETLGWGITPVINDGFRRPCVGVVNNCQKGVNPPMCINPSEINRKQPKTRSKRDLTGKRKRGGFSLSTSETGDA